MSLGIHPIAGEMLLKMLRRVEAGEDPDEVYIEMFANAEQMNIDLEGDDD